MLDEPALDNVGIWDSDSPLANRTEEPGVANRGIEPYNSDLGILKSENCEVECGVENPEKCELECRDEKPENCSDVLRGGGTGGSDVLRGGGSGVNCLSRPARAACADRPASNT